MRSAVLLVIFLLLFCTTSIGGLTKLVSVSPNGTLANGNSGSPMISANGKFVVFCSEASNLVANDINGVADVFVKNLQTEEIERVSVSSIGKEGNAESCRNNGLWLDSAASISGDGRYVAFVSESDNLVKNDTNVARDIFVRDRELKTTVRVSVDSNGQQGVPKGYLNCDAPRISQNGKYVAFNSDYTLSPNDTNNDVDVYVRDMQSNNTFRVNLSSSGEQALNGSSFIESFNIFDNEARFIVFQSYANNLVEGDTNEKPDIFVHDILKGTTKRVNVTNDGQQDEIGGWKLVSISADGRDIIFTSYSSVLEPSSSTGIFKMFIYDMKLESLSTSFVPAYSGICTSPSPSADDRYYAFVCIYPFTEVDPNSAVDGYVLDRVTRTLETVTLANDGSYVTVVGSPSSSWIAENINLSNDGRFVFFDSIATALVENDTNGFKDVFVHDRLAK